MHSWIERSIIVGLVGLLAIGVPFAQEQQEPFDQEKEAIIESVYENPNFLPLMDVKQAKIQLNDLSKSFEQMQSQYAQMDDYSQELEDKYNEVQITIEYIMSDTQRMEQALKEDLTKISVSSKKISSLEQQLTSLKSELNRSKNHLEQYTKFLYKLNNDYYNTADVEMSNVKLFVKSDNIAATLASDELVESMMKRLQELVVTIQDKQTRYTRYAKQINEAKVAYNSSVQKYKLKLKSLQEQKEQLYQLLGYIKNDLSQAKQKINNLQESKSELQDQIGLLQEAATANEHGVDEDSQVYTLLNEEDREDGKKYFSRPVFPIKEIAYYFRDPAYFSEFQEQLDGIRLLATQGQEVRAPAPALVYKAFKSPDIGLSWLVLVHKHGYITVMSPLSEIVVAPGDIVERGEIIGKVGGKPGTVGAGLNSQRAHLDMEVLKNGSNIDPLEIMDISVFASEDKLPEKYTDKYWRDFFSREVDLSVLYELEGETVAARRDDFLDRYAQGPYRDSAIWYDASQETGIDPILGICIAFAETSFKHFKSKNNIGNVGNDDSGNIVEFATPLAGVKALYNVLNNQYLGEYQTLNQLSRYGNREGYIYASSSYNWQKNTMKCLSSIYNGHVPEDYAFRRAK